MCEPFSLLVLQLVNPDARARLTGEWTPVTNRSAPGAFVHARRVEVPGEEAAEACFRLGWSDGLPVVPPTPALVDKMIGDRDPALVLGAVPPAKGVASVEKVAANAVMAGCLPDYFPVVEAILRALLDPVFNLAGVQATTHLASPIAVVSGPVGDRLGINAGSSLFGPGCRANATIGRAVALTLWNLGGARPGVSNMSTFGNPLRYGACIGERRDVSGWPPLQTVRGFPAEVSTVTVYAGEAPKSIVGSQYPEGILETIADCMRTLAAANMHLQGEMLLVLGVEHARALAGAGWDRATVQRYLHEHARRSVGEFRDLRTYETEVWQRFWPDWVDPHDRDARVPVARTPEEILVTVGGGDVGRFSVCCPGWGSGTRAVTVAVDDPAATGRLEVDEVDEVDGRT